MRFLLDANLPRSAIDTFMRFGHEVEFARDVGLAAAPDKQVAAHALKTGAVLVSRDLDFADVRRYAPEDHYGIVVLRLPDSAAAQEIVFVLERFLRERVLVSSLPGRLAIVEVERVRFRPPLA